MNRPRFSVSLAAVSAMYTSGFRTAGFDCTDINLGTGSPPFALRGIGYNSDGTDTSLGAGGTITSETAAVDAKKVIDDAGTDKAQMQADAANTLPPGANTLDSDKKVNDGSDAGLASTAIGDPPAGQTQQV